MARNKTTFVMPKAAAFALSLYFSACATSTVAGGEAPWTMATDDTKATQVVESYVRETQKWPMDAYRVELRRRTGDMFIFWVIHKEDDSEKASLAGGSQKSFEVEVDGKELKILRVLRFQ